MKKETFDEVRNSGRLIYEYIRGSHAYGLNIETSDVDTGGVYITTNDILLGLRSGYCEQIADRKSDNVWYEVGRFLELLLSSNPNMLEALFVPERCILYKHPVMDYILANKHKFLSKKAFNALVGYSVEQIKKARGLNKKIVKPVKVRKTPIDFCYTFKNQGSESVMEFLNSHGLKQIYCGLVHVDNMDQAYAAFYDWEQHIHMEWKTAEEFADFLEDVVFNEKEDKFIETLKEKNYDLWFQFMPPIKAWSKSQLISDARDKWMRAYNEIKPKGYHGIQKEDGSSNEVHLDSVVKGEKPLFHLLYNKNGYASHCREYKDYKDWEKNRNQARYESNLEKNYDAKNIMHCIRLIQMGIELAKTGTLNVDRNVIGDRQFLLDVRNHKYEYDYLIDYAEKKKAELDEAIKTTTLPDEIDREFVNELLINIRKSF